MHFSAQHDTIELMSKISISDRQIVITGRNPGNLARLRPDSLDVPRADDDIDVDEYGNPMTEAPTEDPPGDGYIIDTPGGVFDILPPKNIVVEEQSVRTNPDGSASVDILLSFDSVPEAENYEARVTRE